MNLAIESDKLTENMAFIIYGYIDPTFNINEKVSELLRHFCIGPRHNINFDIVYATVYKEADSGLLESELATSALLSAAQELTEAVRVFNNNQECKKYTTAVLIHSRFLSNSAFNDFNLVLDFSLPKNYLYMAYDEQIDFGYSIDWIWGSAEMISIFDGFDHFVYECLHEKNDYIKQFSKIGWPSTVHTSMVSSGIRELMIFIDGVLAHAYTKRIFLSIGDYGLRKYLGLKKRISHQLLVRDRIAEIHGELSNKPAQRIYRKDLAWNFRPLVKYLLCTSGIRDCVRFLSRDDFEFSETSKASIPINASNQ